MEDLEMEKGLESSIVASLSSPNKDVKLWQLQPFFFP